MCKKSDVVQTEVLRGICSEGPKRTTKNCKLLLSTLRNKPMNFRIGSTDISRPAPTVVIPLLFCLNTL